MKHQTITLLKFKSLSALLEMPLWQVVGILEGLWLFAMHNARNGDLSRFSHTELAAWLEYDGNATELVDALVQNEIDAQDFIDHYEANGWVCGKNQTPMSNWKAAVRTWENKRKQPPAESRVATAADLENFDLVTGAAR